jgi:alcohol dehydrogenase (cytochrome c)
MQRTTEICGALVATIVAIFTLVSARAQSLDSPFTQAQVDSGRNLYSTMCASCHGLDLEGNVGPALVGADFAAKWSRAGHALPELFTVLRTTMPRPAAGSLSEPSYLAVMAYLLSRNGLAAGTRTLAAAADLAAAHLPAPAVAGTAPAETTRGPVPQFLVGESGTTPAGKGPTQSNLSKAAGSGDWLYNSHDYAGTRHAPLAQITPVNASRLQVTCAYQVGAVETFVSGPLVWQGTMYLTTASLTIAIDAATCQERWRRAWTPRDTPMWQNNRGVAIKDGYVVRGTSDGYLVALDAANGQLLWARQVGKPARGETLTMAPLIFEDLVIIGPAGSEANVQGWIGAFHLADGTPAWRFNTVARPGEPGAETWQVKPGVPVGGGGVWTSPSLDVARGELYVPVGNPAPDLPKDLRAGANLYTNSVVALDVRTGALRWHEQIVTPDFHDWDVTHAAPLITVPSAGRSRDLLVAAGKDGVLRTIDRATHERVHETPVTTRENVDAPLTLAGVHACPGALGGVQWNGPAFDPATRLLITPAVDWCTTFALSDKVEFVPGQNYLGGKVTIDEKSQGWLTAIDATTGDVRWRYRSPRPMVAAVTTTAGGLVLTPGASSTDSRRAVPWEAA